MKKIHVAFFVLLTYGCGESQTTNPVNKEKETKVVQEDIRRLYEAIYSADFDKLIDFTHPKIINQLGGRNQARRSLEKTIKPILAIGMKVKDLLFEMSPTFIVGEEHEFVVVPTKVIFEAKGQKFGSHNFQFGVRNSGDTSW